MKPEELIQSGLLEAYAMGTLRGSDAELVENMRAEHPSVAAELDAIEAALEEQALARAVAPPVGLRETIIKKAVSQEGGTPVVPLNAPSTEKETVSRSVRIWPAAAVIGLLISLGVNVMMLNELRNVRGQLARMDQERSVLAEQLQIQRASFEETQQQLAIVSDPQREVVLLKGTEQQEDARARIYWDKEREAVHLDVLRLPDAPAGKQYQLWALVDGQPVDAGVFNTDGSLQAMKEVQSAQAFAVTVEQKGGSPTPTLETMILLGTV